jgi:hypothetical protein
MPANRILLALLLCATCALGADLRTQAGKTVSGEVVSVSDKEAVIKTKDGKSVATPVHELLDIDLQPAGSPPSGKYTDVELTDGSTLHCTSFALKKDHIELKLAVSNLVVKVPLASLTGLLKDAQDAANAQDWQKKVIGKKSNQDILAIRNNGVLNPLEGTLGDVDDKGRITFESSVGETRTKRPIDLTRPQIQGIYFLRRADPKAPARLCNVFDVNGNTLAAAKLSTDPKNFTLTTVSGASLVLPRTAVTRLEFDKIVYLSDLKPAEIVERSRQGRKESMRIDKNLDNTALKLEGQVYSKGMSMHAYTDVTFNLDGKYSKLQALVGMDSAVTGDGKPLVKIEADGKELFAETITRKDKHRELSYDVRGVKQLRIVVSSTGLFDFGDHVDIVNPRLTK